MEKRNVTLSLEDAKKLYNQGGNFRTIALSAYSEEELAYIPKDGDFITSSSGNPFIYKDFECNCASMQCGCYLGKFSGNWGLNETSTPTWTLKKGCRPSTEEEKEELLLELHKIGKDWDPINKKIIPYKWRAEKGGHYYVVSLVMGKATLLDHFEEEDKRDNYFYDNNNYFKTEEEAQAVADKINNIFKEL